VETHKVFESQEFQSVSVCFKISGKENLRDASKSTVKVRGEIKWKRSESKGTRRKGKTSVRHIEK